MFTFSSLLLPCGVGSRTVASNSLSTALLVWLGGEGGTLTPLSRLLKCRTGVGELDLFKLS